MRTDASMKFDEALALLNNAAKEQKGDFVKMLTDKYKDIKEVLVEVGSNEKEIIESVKKAVTENLKEGKEKVSHYTKELDRSVHEHPWAFIAGAAVSAMLLGATCRNSK